MKKVVELYNGTFKCLERLGLSIPGPHDHGEEVPFSKVVISKDKVVKVLDVKEREISISDKIVKEIDEHSSYVIAVTETGRYCFMIH